MNPSYKRFLPVALLTLAAALIFAYACDRHDDVDCSDETVSDPNATFDFTAPTKTCASKPTVFCSALTTNQLEPDCQPADFELEETDISTIQTALQNGQINCQWLIEEHIHLILKHDLQISNGAPPRNSIVTLNKDAIQTAKNLDAHQHCEQKLAGPLHCIPFVVKTNYASTEVPTTNGSLALLDAQPDFDAHTVDRMRRAGAIMLASTSMDEFAQGIHGISGRTGRTGNAFDTRANAGGSSGGAAVAVASNFALAGLGTDNCASLTAPAGYNGLVTMRPTRGLVSTAGIFPSNQVDVVSGPITRSITDLAKTLDILVAKNPKDAHHCTETRQIPQTYTASLKTDGLRSKRIGILRDLSKNANDWDRLPFDGADAATTAHFNAFFEELKAAGATVIDDITLPNFKGRRYSSGTGALVDEFLAKTHNGARSFQAICESGLFSKHVWDNKKDCLNSARHSYNSIMSNIDEGRAVYKTNRQYVESVMDELKLDALVYPTDALGTARPAGSKANCILPSVTGLPTITVNAGYAPNNLPVGMAFTARNYDEPKLFEIAYAYEQATHHRRAPVLPTTPDIENFTPDHILNFNQLHQSIARKSFDEVLKNGGKFDLNGPRFTDIARPFIEQY